MENTDPTSMRKLIELLACLPEDIVLDIYEYNAEHREKMREVCRQLDFARCHHCEKSRPKSKMIRMDYEYENITLCQYFCDDFCIGEAQLEAYAYFE